MLIFDARRLFSLKNYQWCLQNSFSQFSQKIANLQKISLPAHMLELRGFS